MAVFAALLRRLLPADDPPVQKLIGTSRYAERKMQSFRAGGNLDIASNDAVALSDDAARILV